MKLRWLTLTLVPLTLAGCRKQGDYDGYKHSLVSSAITAYSGRVRLLDSTGSVNPFDTSILANIYSRPDNLTGLKEAFDFSFKKYHALFDRYHSYSIDGVPVNNIKTINDSYGTDEPIKVDPVLFDTLKKAIAFTKETDGLFNIAVGALTTLWSDQIERAVLSSKYIDESYESGRLIYDDPSPADIAAATVCVPSASVIDDVLVLDSRRQTVTFKRFSGCDEKAFKPSLTLGAVGKGMAADLFADLFPDLSFLLNAGQSSVKTQNYKNGQSPWRLQIANPQYNEKIAVIGDAALVGPQFHLNSSEVYFERGGNFNFSTSGYYNNYFLSAEAKVVRSHIVNPKTGYSETAFDAVSVFTDEAGYGDMYSTALTNAGSVTEAQSLLAKLNRTFGQHAVAYYVVRENGREVFYVPEELAEVITLKDPKADRLPYDLVSEIRVIGQ